MNTLNTSEAEKNIIIVPDFQVYPCKTFSGLKFSSESCGGSRGM